MTKLDEALALFPSCIKGGENWSPICQEVLDAAKAELAALRLAAQADAPDGQPQSPSREALAEAWFVGHCRARGFLFPEIDIQGSKGSFLWGQAMMDAVALLPDTRPDREGGA